MRQGRGRTFLTTSTTCEIGVSPEETIGYIAFAQGTGTTDGYAYEVGVEAATVEAIYSSPFRINLTSFTATPDVVVKTLTKNGADGHWTRGVGVAVTSVSAFTEEDTVNDPEQGHAPETFAWAAFDAGTVFINDPDAGCGDGMYSKRIPTRSQPAAGMIRRARFPPRKQFS